VNKFKSILKDADKHSNKELLEVFIEVRGALKGLLTTYKPSRKEKDLLDVVEVYNELLIKKLKECKDNK